MDIVNNNNQQSQKNSLTRSKLILIIGGVIVIILATLIVWISVDSTSSHSKPIQSFNSINSLATDDASELSYGKWSGATKQGQPHGNGTLEFTSRRLVSQFDRKATVANPGDYVIGEYNNGQLLHGRLYRTNGTTTDILCTPPSLNHD